MPRSEGSEDGTREYACVYVTAYMCLCMIDMIDKCAGVCEREGENEEGMNE